MPKSVPRKTHSKNMAALQTQKSSATIPLTHVNSPKTGKSITIKSAIQQGFMLKSIRDGITHLKWTERALPPETPRETHEREETVRLSNFLRKHIEVGRPWPIPDLNAVIESDNGRFRLWIEIGEKTRERTLLRNYKLLSNWKARLVEEEGPDPLSHPVDMIVAQYRGDNDSPAMGPSEIARSINQWIAKSLYHWEKASSQSRRRITRDLLAVLKLFDITGLDSIGILDRAQNDIHNGRKPFQRSMKYRTAGSRAPYPVTAEIVKSKLRTWARS